MKLMLWAKSLLQRLHLASWLVEFCHDCGVRQPLVWWADDALYREICGGKGVLCPECFNKRAHRLGILLRWMPTIKMRKGEAIRPVGEPEMYVCPDCGSGIPLIHVANCKRVGERGEE